MFGRFIAIAAAGLSIFSANAADLDGRTFEFEYRASLDEAEGDAKMWVPLPRSSSHQSIEILEIESNAEHRAVTEATHGNQFLLFERDGGNIDAVITYRVARSIRTGADAAPLTGDERERYLQPTSTVPINGKVREEAIRIAGGAESHAEIARSLYDHIVDTVRYDKSGEGWGRGDAVYACDVRAGNCTDFHSLFIGEARALGVPSRFLMGFSVPNDAPSGEIGGYHCWAEFYIEGEGWLPIDASEAFKDQSRREELFGGLDADRVQFTTGRDLQLPEMQGEPLNFAIYPYAEVDGEPFAQSSHSFQYRDVR